MGGERMETDGQEISDLRDWLRRNGYVFEMEVASAIIEMTRNRPKMWVVEQGVQYSDVISGKIRESDVAWGFMIGFDSKEVEPPRTRRHAVSYRFSIECKNTSAPWVLFLDRSPARYALSLDHPDIIRQCKWCRMIDLADNKVNGPQDCPTYFPGPLAYAVSEKRTKGDRDHAREAVLSAISAALAVRKERIDDPEDIHGAVHSLPVVITSSPLYTVELDNDGEPNLIKVGYHRLSGHHEGADCPVNVDIVNFGSLNDWVERMLSWCETLDANLRASFKGTRPPG